MLRFVSKRAAFPPLGLPTVAAMLPRDWQLKVVDLNVERLRDEELLWADYVMLSAMLVHQSSVREVVARCAALGKPVIAGGPLFTTGHEGFPEIGHVVLGEAEEVMPRLVADLQAGRLQRAYKAPGWTKPQGTGNRWSGRRGDGLETVFPQVLLKRATLL